MVLLEIIDDSIIVIPLFDVDNKPAAVTLPIMSLSSVRTPPSLENKDPPIPFFVLAEEEKY